MTDDTEGIRSLYWSGTFIPPTLPGDYAWESVANHRRTNKGILASAADTKQFSYEDGMVCFDAIAVGLRKPVCLRRGE